MPRNEINTDNQIYEHLKRAKIDFTAQGSNIKEIANSLRTASKNMTGRSGYPEYVAVVKDFVLVIEDKYDTRKHCKKINDVISQEQRDVQEYAVNGALWYAKHIAKNTNYKKVFAFGCSGINENLIITPLFVDDREYCIELPDVTSFINFSEDNIKEYYERNVLGIIPDKDKTTLEILKDAAELHEELRNYGSIKDADKPLIVSGILLALNEIRHNGFSINDLNGDNVETDGNKIFKAIENDLRRANIQPEVKREKLLNQFALIKDTPTLNEKHKELGKTPLKHYTEFIYEKLFTHIKYTSSSEDYIGRFYGEFMSYSGGDGQSLGIVLTPKHITELFCDLVDLKPTDKVLDPCCGTAGFLITAMNKMFSIVKEEDGITTKEQFEQSSRIKEIKKNGLHGIELQPSMFAVAVTNMILRGDGKSNIINDDFLAQNPNILQLKGCNIGMINPPYSQGKTNSNLKELCFVKHLLDSIVTDGKVVSIQPLATMAGTKQNIEIKKQILKSHTLEGVITLNNETFHGAASTHTCIAVFTAGTPHPEDKEVKFIDFSNDGYQAKRHVGLIADSCVKDKKEHLLDVWFDRVEDDNDFIIKSKITAEDEWLHSYFYYNKKLPTEQDFKNAVKEYLSYEYTSILENREVMFEKPEKISLEEIPELTEKEWKPFKISDIFTADNLKKGNINNAGAMADGSIAYIGASNKNNGVQRYVEAPENMVFEGNCIAFIGGGDGSAGLSIYRSTKAVYASNVICGYSDKMNKYNGLFIQVCVDESVYYDKEKGIRRYSHGYPRAYNRLIKDKIMLPVNDEGDPDFDYMEKYMKNVFLNLYNKTNNFYENIILKDEA